MLSQQIRCSTLSREALWIIYNFFFSHVFGGDLLLRLHAAGGHRAQRHRVPGVLDANQRHDEGRTSAQLHLHPHHQHRHQHLRRGPLWPWQFPGMGLRGRQSSGPQLQLNNCLRMISIQLSLTRRKGRCQESPKSLLSSIEMALPSK